MHGSCSPRRLPSPKLVALVLALCALPLQLAAQAAQNPTGTSSQLKPLSVPHLYWHFLIHQSELDAYAAKLTAEGYNGKALRDDMQIRLGFSDADYAPIRTSSQQLASELQPIEAQLQSLMKSPFWSPSQVQPLIAQREADINNVVYNLSNKLSAKNKAALESFMRSFFAPKAVSTAAVAKVSGSTSKEMQQ